MSVQKKAVLKVQFGRKLTITPMDTLWKRLMGAWMYEGLLGFTNNTSFHTFFLKKPLWYCAFNKAGEPITPLMFAPPGRVFTVPQDTAITIEFTQTPPPGPYKVVWEHKKSAGAKSRLLSGLIAIGLLNLNPTHLWASEPPLVPAPQEIHKKRLEKHKLSVLSTGGSWVVHPEVETPDQLGALAKLCQNGALKGLKLDWQPGIALSKALPHALNPYWQLLGEPQLYIEAHNGSYALKGIRQNPESQKITGDFLECLLGHVPDLSLSGGGSLQSVRMSLRFLELSRQKKESTGFSNPLVGTPEEAFQGLLKALSERSYAKEIASPMLISRSGETATLHVGGEVPIVHTTSKSNTTTYKPYGVELKVIPKSLSKDTVVLDFHLRVSAVENPSNPYPPAFTVREVKSRLTLGSGQVSVLGSFSLGKSNQWSESPTHLKSFPLLKRWFSKERSAEMDMELWITLRPETLLELTTPPVEALP